MDKKWKQVNNEGLYNLKYDLLLQINRYRYQ